ncbi:LTA synthase family protein [Kordiimonas aquimaris]|uniref:LTA synthase family protein n=1 Tax=Kordiimonas aquimaris TaxID=707591 RepID=UPI0021CFE588|nr:sulfatase-like hydrolase/transferase [Kordiimonas aquimaris]
MNTGNIGDARRIIFIGITLLVLFFFSSEAFLIHKTEAYFLEDSLNKYFSLSQYSQVFYYFVGAVISDLFFYGTLAVGVFFLLSRVSTLNMAQRIATIFCIVVFGFVLNLVVKYGIFSYFGTKFDLQILKELSGGAYVNLFHTIDAYTMLLSLLMLVVTIVFFGVVLYLLRNVKLNFIMVGQKRFIVAAVCFGWVIIGFLHFNLYGVDRALWHGFYNKMSYRAIDIILANLSDFDGDGYGPLTQPKDPDNFSANVEPYAIEIPDNGLDENGIGGDLKQSYVEATKRQIKEPLKYNGNNVILIVVESFKVAPVNAVYDGQEAMPFFNELKRKHAYTDWAISNYGVTSRSIQTLFAGKTHYNKNSIFLSDLLKMQGYSLYAVSAQNENWGDTAEYIRLADFDHFYDAKSKAWNLDELSTWKKLTKEFGLKLRGDEVNEEVFSLLDQKRTQPFMLYINYQELHYPYFNEKMEKHFIKEGNVRSGFFAKENKDQIFRQYANAARNLDAHIGHLFAYLEENNLSKNTTVVIVGDHPDSFYENDLLGHAWALDKSQRQTPLIIVNGKGEYTYPVGQDEIAGIIMSSLDASVDEGPIKISLEPSKTIFELTGTINKPRQIAWISHDGLSTYDFMTGLFQLKEGEEWQNPTAFRDGSVHQTVFKSLVNRWESELLLSKSN